MNQLTPAQQAVVEAPVCNILVSAAAGSGKTRVLTDRIVQRIISGQTDVRSILVMTFTDMAARQMRDKIAEKLRNTLTVATDEATIDIVRRQLLLLPGALISTIHAFCLTVIRNFYYEARGTDGEPLVLPDFSIDDGSESDILFRDALDTLFQECHEAIDLAEADIKQLTVPAELAAHLPEGLHDHAFTEAFYRLVDGYGSAKGDEPLKELVLTVYKYLRSMPDYASFVRGKVAEYEQAAAGFAHSPAASVLMGQLKLRLDRALMALPELESMLGSVRFYVDRKKNDDMAAQFRGVFTILRTLHAGLVNGSLDYDDVYRESRTLATVSAPRGGKSDMPEKQAFTELFSQSVAEAIYTASGGAGQKKCLDAFQFDPLIVCERPSAEIESELKAMLPAVQCLFALVLAVDARYSEQKRQAGIIEFSDFEHLALTILRSPEAGTYYRSRISEIYIDEYQDTSSIQEAIIASITNSNCLMVGDVKQSIYRFRHARPQIFLDKQATFATGIGGTLFELNRNFRSQQGIVDTVNQWFAQLMSEAAGEIRYDERHVLIAGAEPVFPEKPAVLLLFLDLAPPAGALPDNQESENGQQTDNDVNEGIECQEEEPTTGEHMGDLSRDRKEALMVTTEILRLASAGTPYKDIAILARTRSILNQYAATLTEKAIPILEEAEQAFLDSPILRLMEALIHLVDNRRQDIPLAAVMRSTIYAGGFTDDEMARIRLAARMEGPKPVYFHEAVDWYAGQGGEETLRSRVDGFIRFLDQLREKESLFAIGELLDLIFQQTGFRDRTARQTDGLAQVADLDRFKAFAEQYEQRTRRGVYAFARYIERLHALEKQQPNLPGEQSEQNAVRLLTMHRSKGLEFPVVFIVGTAYQLNIREKNQHLLLSEQLGIGPDFVDPDRQVLYPTPLKQAMFEALKAKNRSEELRLLYVAMTRAMQVLYLTGCFKVGADGDPAAIRLIGTARSMTGTSLPEHLVLAARSYQEWLLLALARNNRVDLSPLYGQTPEDPIREPLPDGIAIPVTFHTLNDLNGTSSLGLNSADQLPEPMTCTIGLQEKKPDLSTDNTNPAADLASPESRDAAFFSSALILTDPLPEGIDEPLLPDVQKHAVEHQIKTVILGQYPYQGSMRLPQKISVTELKRRSGQLEEEADTPAGSATIHGVTQAVSAWIAPAERQMTASETGTAAHQAFRFFDVGSLVADPSPEEIARQLARLQEHQILSEEARTAIQPMIRAYCRFFASPLAARLHQAEQRGQLYREMPFTIAVSASEVSPDSAGIAPSDRLFVQGMIDLWFREGDKAVLIDFKTDRLSGNPDEREKTLRNRYRLQIEYYAQAIRLATGLPVTEQLIYAVQDERFIEMTAPEAVELDKGTTR